MPRGIPFFTANSDNFVKIFVNVPLLQYLCTPEHYKMTKRILLIADIVGVGRVGITASMPVLMRMGYDVANLPTSLVSNNFGYGRYAMRDMGSYLTEALGVWDDLDFSYDGIMTGFIPSEEQAEDIAAYCRRQRAHGSFIAVDPVMGDGGTLYSGLPPKIVTIMRDMVGISHLTCPNYTEACYLLSDECKEKGVTKAEAFSMLRRLHEMGAESVVITSITVDGQTSVAGFDGKKNSDNKEFTDCRFILPYKEIPVMFSGTGDVFLAFLVGKLMAGEDLKTATQYSIDTVAALIKKFKDYPDKYLGLPL